MFTHAERDGYLDALPGIRRKTLSYGAETREVGPGDSWSIPGAVPHGAVALEDTVAVEVFSPVREDYLP